MFLVRLLLRRQLVSGLSIRRLTTDSENISKEASEDQKETKSNTVSSESEKSQIEIDGPKGPEPTRYGDWERKGRCIDF